ncbi:conserved hypothetical protein [Tenacibaculum maritimum]|uniref:hypothetical protein n=1 Tax=Tenacibaculum maritimum TaxID=107401 RepID=UPI0012E68DFF|nr:hypothetical protein [Tenacibaculum maritimum]CAA0198682.1 conserved hypothetical protein [Tenacibaculum maritimum]
MRKSSSIRIKRTLFKLIYIIIILIGINKSIAQQKTKRQFDIPTFEKNKIENEYTFHLDKNILIKQTEWDKEYTSLIRDKNSLFETLELYYKNGELKSEIKRFYKSFVINYIDYDEQGNLIREENLDTPFTYSWKDITAYLAKHGVKDLKKQVIGISRWHHQEKATWTLEFNGIYNNTKGRFVITLNGKTGEVLEVKLFKGKKALGKTGTIADYQILYKKED